MDDLVKRLRQCLPKEPGHTHRLPTLDMVREAADRIEALMAENRNLRMEMLAVLGQQIDAPPEAK